MAAKPNFNDRIVPRIIRISAALGIVGTVAVWIRFGTRAAVGFLVGSLLSLLNFHGLRRVAEGLTGMSSTGLKTSPVFWAFRYMLLMGIGYVIVRGLGISLTPILAGLFVAAAAIILEILYELTYART